MLTVLLLAGAEKLINVALMSDEIPQAGLEPLAGKVLRLNMAMPGLFNGHLPMKGNITGLVHHW